LQSTNRVSAPVLQPDLPRRLGVWDAASIVVGIVIGGGIFVVPSIIARHVPSTSGAMLIWVLGGIITFFGALAYAELGAMFPATGGQYVFLREAYGPGMAFLCGWTICGIVLPAMMAALAVAFSAYLGHFIPLSPLAAKAASGGIILLMTAINYSGVRLGAAVQNTCTILKLGGIAAIVISALWVPAVHATSAAESTPISWAPVAAALTAVLLAYDGWNLMTAIGGEIRNPQRNVPLGLALGVGLIMAAYLSVNWAYLHVLPAAEIAASERPGSLVADRTLGSAGAAIISVTILVSILGSINGGVLVMPRLVFAQARDRLFFARLGEVHPRFRTPSAATVAEGVWTAVLAISGSYELLITYAVFCEFVFYLAVISALMRLRHTQSERFRPYRMWGYPVTPLLFLAAALWYVVASLLASPKTSITALALIAMGAVVYLVWRRSSQYSYLPKES